MNRWKVVVEQLAAQNNSKSRNQLEIKKKKTTTETQGSQLGAHYASPPAVHFSKGVKREKRWNEV